MRRTPPPPCQASKCSRITHPTTNTHEHARTALRCEVRTKGRGLSPRAPTPSYSYPLGSPHTPHSVCTAALSMVHTAQDHSSPGAGHRLGSPHTVTTCRSARRRDRVESRPPYTAREPSCTAPAAPKRPSNPSLHQGSGQAPRKHNEDRAEGGGVRAILESL